MLAGVECMAEGHSFHLANNVILIAYSWAYDKFKQALDRVHRMNSVKPVNVYVVLCQGSIDRKLESLVQEKGDAAELVLDGQLIGERSEEVNLAELLKVAQREFNEKDKTLDEMLLQSQWPTLRDRLSASMRSWDPTGEPRSAHIRPINPPSLPQPQRFVATTPDRFDPLANMDATTKCSPGQNPEAQASCAASNPGNSRNLRYGISTESELLPVPTWKKRLRLIPKSFS